MRWRFARACTAKFAAASLWLGAAPHAAQAGAWTLPEGSGQFFFTAYGWNGRGASPPLPAPRESRREIDALVEYGVSNRLTVFGEASIARSAFGAPNPGLYQGIDYAGAGARYAVWTTQSLVVAVQGAAYAPGARDATAPAQAGNTGGMADARLLVGHGFTVYGLPAFVNVEGAYRFRAAGPPGEWHVDATFGIRPSAKWQVLFQVFNTVSSPSLDPSFPAWSSSVGQASVVYEFAERWSIQGGLFGTLYRSKTNSERGLVLSVWRRF